MSERRTLSLPCRLTSSEWEARSREMAAVEAELLEAEQREEAYADESKYHKKALENETEQCRGKLRMLGRIVRDGEEERQVDVIDEKDFVVSAVNTIRVDTGEIVKTRAMNENDRQRAMFVAGEKTGTSD